MESLATQSTRKPLIAKEENGKEKTKNIDYGQTDKKFYPNPVPFLRISKHYMVSQFS